MLPIETAFKVFTDRNGKPLENGFIYFGVPNQNPVTSPVTVYWDSAGTQPALQPLRTENGYIMRSGTPANVFVAGAYSELVRDSKGRQVFFARTSDDFSVIAAVLNFIDSLAAPSGSSLIGFVQAGAGAVERTAQDKMRDYITVNDFVTGGLGTSGSPWTGWDTAIVWAGHTQYDFLDGWYAYATSPNFAKDNLRLNGKAGTNLRHTGAGWAMLADAGAAASVNILVDIKMRLFGNALSSGGVYMRSCSRSKFDMFLHDIPGICFNEINGVLNKYNLVHTWLTIGPGIQPLNLLSSSMRAVGEDCNANEYHLCAENVSNYGVVLNECSTSLFYGTSEANAMGMYIGAGSKYNTLMNMDFEINTGVDLDCYGSYNTLIGTLSTKTVNIIGNNNTLIAGTYNIINNSGARNDYRAVRYSNNGGAFTDTGADIVKQSVYNVATSLRDADKLAPVDSIKSGSGSVVMATATATTLFAASNTGRYEIVAYVISGDAANFSASATVLNEGAGSTRIIANNGAALTLTLSGNNVRATQSSGANATVRYSFLRIF